MLIQTNLELLWAVNPSPEEVKGIERHKVSDRLWHSRNSFTSPFMAGMLAFLAIVSVIGLMSQAPTGSTADTATRIMLTMMVAAGIVWPPVVAYRHSRHITKYWHMKKAGRVIDLRDSFGEVLLDGVLFYGDFDLDSKRRKKVLEQADTTLIDMFLLDKLNLDLLALYLQYYNDDAGEILRAVLLERAQAIIDDIEPYAAPLRIEQAEEDAKWSSVTARNETLQAARVAEVRQFLQEHQLLAEV